MKRDRSAEGERRLATSEALLRKSLLEVLPAVVKTGAPLFTNSKHNLHDLPKHLIDEEAEAFLEMALACVELREHLGLVTDESVGRLFLAACEEGSSSDENRRGPRKLAEALVERLRNDG
ncbi:hypothetical protein [Polaromonas sp. JS666]|uniref:hypothetical protein n=1 Tax=Polaromonas sp. (strain JS666 / ATCC BAA-500) TaxID=296591 RepID=UPI0000534424|nr:hypothetical protein [Polaromonas sp. JS666]ABE43578.1 hypothetical protein Bpro_1642 [Polaromonas sp. JS666]